MRWKEIKENASCGATGSASVATATSALGAKGAIGVGFDPNGDKGIYQNAKKTKKLPVARR